MCRGRIVFFVFYIILVTFHINFAQPIDIQIGSKSILYPFAGGLKNPVFSQIEWNGDVYEDLFIFDKASELTFVYLFSEEKNEFVYSPNSEVNIRCHQWALSRDFNGDNVPDIITLDGPTQNARVIIYEGRETVLGETIIDEKSVSYFVGIADEQGSFADPLILPITSNFEVVDLNDDTHLDLLVFTSDEQSLQSFENLSVFIGDYLLFQKTSDCFGYFRKVFNENKIIINPQLAACPESRKTHLVHGGSSVSAADLNCDKKPDLLIGDGLDGNLFLLTNESTVPFHWMTDIQPNFPLPSAITPTWASGYPLIHSKDSIISIIVTNNNVRTGTTSGVVKKFTNIGDNCTPSYVLQTQEFLKEDMLSVGVASKATFFDYNMDNLPDLVIGSHNIDNNGIFFSSLTLIENKGQDRFEIVDKDWLGLSTSDWIKGGRVSPAFGDLDGDNLLDLLIGDGYGNLHFLRNKTFFGDTVQTFSDPITNYYNIFTGLNCVPLIHDFNDDGLNDIIISKWKPGILLFKNLGNRQQPMFISDTNNSANQIVYTDVFVNQNSDKINTFISKFEYNSEDHFIFGFRDGRIESYHLEEDAGSYIFRKSFTIDSSNFMGINSTPFVYKSENGTMSIWVGNESGGFRLLQNNLSNIKNNNDINIKYYPNPFDEYLILQGFTNVDQVLLIDLFGNRMEIEVKIDYDSIQFDTSNILPGIYFVYLRSSDKNLCVKVVKL
ncbi:MAG: T9SS type A sorting domain-containing protein [Saprospiraceae bacterium]